MSGIGDVLLKRLTEVPSATGAELAALVPEKPFATVHSRLCYLAGEKRVVRLSKDGKAQDHVWTLEGALPFEAKEPKKRPTLPSVAEQPAGQDERKRPNVWKPLHVVANGLVPFPVDRLPRKGDNVVVSYPEPWRDDTLACLCRDPDEHGVTLAWDLRIKQYCYVRVVGNFTDMVSRVADERTLERLKSE